MEMLPFGNSIDLLQLKGKTIRNIIGKSAAGIGTSEDHKAFLQVSGKTWCKKYMTASRFGQFDNQACLDSQDGLQVAKLKYIPL